MAKHYKTNDADAPYGLTKAGVPRKRPGCRKGVAKTPGSGRKKIPIEDQLDAASDEFALLVISGEPIKQYGSTGKAFTAPAPLALRKQAVDSWWDRRRPTLTSRAVKAEVKAEITHTDPPEPRELARAVLSILSNALPEKDPEASPRQLTYDKDKVSDASEPKPAVLEGGASRDAKELDASPDSNECEPGERTVFDNGVEVIHDGERGKWAIFDSCGELHGYRRSRADAETFAATLPGPAAMTAVGQKRT